MAQANDFIKRLAKAGGLPETNTELLAILANEELSKIEIPDLFENLIHQNLMNVEAAKNNSKLSEHFKAQHLNGLDALLLEKASEKGFEASDIEELKGAEKTGKRIAMLLDKLEKKGAPKDKGEKAEWDKKVSDLHTQLSDAKTNYETKLTEAQNKFVGIQKNTSLDALLSQHQYGVDLPQDVILDTVKNLINRKISEKKYRHEYDPETNKHSLKGDDGLEVYNGNTPVLFNDFVQSVISENKLLKVSGDTPKPAAQTQTTTTNTAPIVETPIMESHLAHFAK